MAGGPRLADVLSLVKTSPVMRRLPLSMPSADDPCLKRRGGIISGFAVTYSRVLRASRAEIIDAVEGPGPVEPLVLVNGHRGTDHAGASTNRIQSDAHPECCGIDRVFLATTPEQFEALTEAVGASRRVT